MIILQILLTGAATYFTFYSLYWLILTLVGLSHRPATSKNNSSTTPEILLVLPAYQPSQRFYDVLDALPKAIQNRPIKVLVLLQDADERYYHYATAKGFTAIQKSFAQLQGNSYQHALRWITRWIEQQRLRGACHPEFVMLIDKDNVLAADFFDHIEAYQYDQFDILQGARKSVSTSTTVAFFDHLSERLNDLLYRAAKEKAHLFLEISGSGALIETDLFIRCIRQLDPNAPGFDKNFMVQLLSQTRPVKATFLPSCVVTEEKTDSIHHHNPQRIRWFGEQYYNAIHHAGTLLRAAVQLRRLAPLDYWITLCRPPRSIQVVLSPLFCIAECLFFWFTGMWPAGAPLFSIAWLLLLLAIFIFLFHEGALVQAALSVGSLLKLAYFNLFNAAKSVRAENRGKFIHTTHQL